MNRREFLKAGGAAIAAASFPKIAATAAPAKSELRHVQFYDAPSYGPGRWDEFNPAVTIAVSAMTAHVRLQQEGYTLIPF